MQASRHVRSRALVAALAATLLVTGCGASAGQIGTTGIDTLVVPTPGPEQRDFVAVVDNPWFDLTPGTVWRYRSSAQLTDEGTPLTLTVAVLAESGEVDGVRTTRVRSTSGSGTEAVDVIDDFAQDRAGNVWWFAREGLWQVGPPAAEESGAAGAGLFWPAEPRLGDGWSQVAVPGQVEQNVEVTARRVAVNTPLGNWTDAVESTSGDPRDPASRTRTWWVEGVGPVRQETATGGVLDLVEHTRP